MIEFDRKSGHRPDGRLYPSETFLPLQRQARVRFAMNVDRPKVRRPLTTRRRTIWRIHRVEIGFDRHPVSFAFFSLPQADQQSDTGVDSYQTPIPAGSHSFQPTSSPKCRKNYFPEARPAPIPVIQIECSIVIVRLGPASTLFRQPPTPASIVSRPLPSYAPHNDGLVSIRVRFAANWISMCRADVSGFDQIKSSSIRRRHSRDCVPLIAPHGLSAPTASSQIFVGFEFDRPMERTILSLPQSPMPCTLRPLSIVLSNQLQSSVNR